MSIDIRMSLLLHCIRDSRKKYVQLTYICLCLSACLPACLSVYVYVYVYIYMQLQKEHVATYGRYIVEFIM